MSGPGLSRAILAAQPGAPAVGVGPAAPAVAPAVAPAPWAAARRRQANPHGAIGGPPLPLVLQLLQCEVRSEIYKVPSMCCGSAYAA